MRHYTPRELAEIDEYANFWMTRLDAETVACTYCAAAAGQTCLDPDTGEAVPYPAHWHRIKKSEHPSAKGPTR